MDSSAPRSSRSHALSLTTIAGRPAPTGDHAHAETVGASLLAMDSSAPRLSRSHALSLTTIAGKPAPTGDHAHAETVGASLLAMDSSAPRSSRSHALSLTTIAGRPAPTRDRVHQVTRVFVYDHRWQASSYNFSSPQKKPRVLHEGRGAKAVEREVRIVYAAHERDECQRSSRSIKSANEPGSKLIGVKNNLQLTGRTNNNH
ncbi:hypothetical protein PputUW4_02722 [Pseudomonas sp. UW4]|nr:hypothetical protein PputUW4_02722 [Pseudomonas sp. UW4]